MRLLFPMETLLKRRVPRVVLLLCADVLSLLGAFALAVWSQAVISHIDYTPLFILEGQSVLSPLQLSLFGAVYLAAFAALGLYTGIWTVSGLDDGIRAIAGVSVGYISTLLINLAFGNTGKIVLTLTAFWMGVMLFVSRFGYRALRLVILRMGQVGRRGRQPLLIVGAGFFGTYVQGQLQHGDEAQRVYVVAFADDDPEKQGTRLNGVRVRGKIADIPQIVADYGITEIVVAIHNADEKRMAEIVELCASTRCRVRNLPAVSEWGDRAPTIKDIRETRIEDVLFREQTVLDTNRIYACIAHKSVLITGGGGSIGSEIARQVAKFHPSQLTLFDIYENTTYELYCELKHSYPLLNVNIRIGSVRDAKRIAAVMDECRPFLVVHAAAHKHVPLMEDSPGEAVINNVEGTLLSLRAAHKAKVARFVQLSTDKAVNPVNVMGASKRVAELLVQAFSHETAMSCISVRFGNVLGSHGSVIPLFEKQIRAGGPVLVTHPEITRYFMTIPEAAQLVLQAGAFGESGFTYVLDMGQPVKIMDLAEKVIRFHGYTPNVDMPVEIVGLRPGEKMFEELLMDEETDKMQTTAHGRIFRTQPTKLNIAVFQQDVNALIKTARERGDVRAALKKLVSSYTYDEQIREA